MNSKYNYDQTIKAWAEDDRPREKLLLKGRSALSDAELIAILLGSGTRNETAVDLGKRILGLAENNLEHLGKLTIADFKKIKGIGNAKAITLLAAFELGMRRREFPIRQLPKINSVQVAHEYFAARMGDLDREQFWVMYLTQSNRIIKMECISSGGLTGTVVDPRIIFKRALEENAAAIIMGHNHPGGTNKPSDADDTLTKRINDLGKLMQVRLLDHIIVYSGGFYSYADQGRI
jgi:DNA repair protein RadC